MNRLPVRINAGEIQQFSTGDTYSPLVQYVLIQSLGDFPAPVSGVITLASNTTYQINGNIDILANRFVTSGNVNFIGLNRVLDRITASLTGNMFTSSNNIAMSSMSLSCANGTLFNFTGGNLVMFQVAFSNVKNVGTFNGTGTVSIKSCTSIAQITNSGFSFSGACGDFEVKDCIYQNNTGTVFDLTTSTWNSIIISNGNKFTANATQTILNGTTNSGNINSGGTGIIDDNVFFGAGNYVTGIAQIDILWKFQINAGLVNSEPRGSFNMIGNATATVISAPSTPVKIAGITTVGTVEHFSHSTNRLTYIGIDTVRFLVIFNASYSIASNNNTIRFFIAKNGVVLTTSTQKIKNSSTSALVVVPVCDDVLFTTNDFVEAWVQNDTGANNLTVDTLNFQII